MNDNTKSQVYADTMLLVQSGNVIIDNVWLWRADHDEGGLVKNGNNPCKHGIEVNGDDVYAYGLFSEHCLEDLTLWNGAGGKIYMYQSEFPYDVTASYGSENYGSITTTSNVKDMEM